MHGLDFRVLGPLEVSIDTRRVPVAAGKQRVLLATLLLSANRFVAVEELTERLWGGDPPRAPRGALHTYVTRLRQTLDPLAARGGDGPIRTSAAGYGIEVSAGGLDLIRFRDMVGAARTAGERGDLPAESDGLTRALDLWRGPVLPDVRSDSLHRDVVPSLVEEHLRTLERRHEVDLALGRHDRLVGELRALTGKHPFHERFWGQLMVALYRCGRPAEALEVYAEVTKSLRNRLGVRPGHEVRDLHIAILRDDPRLSSTPPEGEL
ncbi:AfsR/SARP family transcriptional regulator [Actinomadura sp. DC4]|uniref:AfsR/SARP family transcriptional regulator n=1 Tax=Actinomadura sp. DC4 TaxID=3055069 RepID=UPI0025AFAE39|nr:AfsR/SARP family transcriptional regulator [Actinomadura sp. DC4]MDN3353271.1 AfsR/SARP family transcriptional regulator [Actinomadura sp. DC4]